MATPEISHRCALCGAAIRIGALSCPNCGQEDARPTLAETPVPAEPLPVTINPAAWYMQADLPADLPAMTEAKAEIAPPAVEILAPPVYQPARLEAPAVLPPRAAAPADVPVLEIPPLAVVPEVAPVEEIVSTPAEETISEPAEVAKTLRLSTSGMKPAPMP